MSVWFFSQDIKSTSVNHHHPVLPASDLTNRKTQIILSILSVTPFFSFFPLFSLSLPSPELLNLLAYFNQIFLRKISNILGSGKFHVFLKISVWVVWSYSTEKSRWCCSAAYISDNQVMFTWDNISINSIIWHFYLTKPTTKIKTSMLFTAYHTP